MNRNLKNGGTNIIFIGMAQFIFALKQKFDENFWFEYQKKIWKMIQHLDTLNSLVSINKILVSIHGKSEL